MSPTVPLSLFREDEEGSKCAEPTVKPLEWATDPAGDGDLRSQLDDAPLPRGAAADGEVAPPPDSDGVSRAKPPPTQPGEGIEALPRLKPCPYCGEKLVAKGDQDGRWYGHRDEAGKCWQATARICDEEDARRWNVRSQTAGPAPVSRSITGPNGLEPKQELFVTEYLKDRNATQAAIRAGYSKKTARQMGGENLTKPAIRDEINRRIEEHSRTAGIDRIACLAALDAAFRADIRNAFDASGNILPPEQWPDDVALLVTSYHPGTPTTAAKIRFYSRIHLGLRLLDAIRPLEQNVRKTGGTAIPTFDVDKMIEGIKRTQAITKGVT